MSTKRLPRQPLPSSSLAFPVPSFLSLYSGAFQDRICDRFEQPEIAIGVALKRAVEARQDIELGVRTQTHRYRFDKPPRSLNRLSASTARAIYNCLALQSRGLTRDPATIY